MSWLITVDRIEYLSLEVEAVDVIERAIELNFEYFVFILEEHLGLASLLRLLKEAEESTKHEAYSTILKDTNEPGDNKDPEFEFINVPELSHDGLWNKSAS